MLGRKVNLELNTKDGKDTFVKIIFFQRSFDYNKDHVSFF